MEPSEGRETFQEDQVCDGGTSVLSCSSRMAMTKIIFCAQVELEQLTRKPVCFVVIGKPVHLCVSAIFLFFHKSCED